LATDIVLNIPFSGQLLEVPADAVVDSVNKIMMLPDERLKLAGIEEGAAALPIPVSGEERTEGTSTEIRSFTPEDIAVMAAAFGSGGGGGGGAVSSVFGRIGAITAQNGDYNAGQITDTGSKVLMTVAERTKLSGIADGAEVNTVTSVHGRTGTVASASGDYNADQISDTASKVLMTAAERTKLTGIAANADTRPTQVSTPERSAGTETALRSFSPSDVAAMAAIHGGGGGGGAVSSVFGRVGDVDADVGDYSADQIFETTTAKIMTDLERTKLAGIEAGAQINTVTSVFGRTGAVVSGSSDYTAAQIAETASRLWLVPAERAKLGGIEAGAQVNTVTSVAGRTGAIVVTKSDVALGNVTNDAQLKASLAYSAKTTPVATDKLVILDSADGQPKTITYAQTSSGTPASVAVSYMAGAPTQTNIPAGVTEVSGTRMPVDLRDVTSVWISTTVSNAATGGGIVYWRYSTDGGSSWADLTLSVSLTTNGFKTAAEQAPPAPSMIDQCLVSAWTSGGNVTDDPTMLALQLHLRRGYVGLKGDQGDQGPPGNNNPVITNLTGSGTVACPDADIVVVRNTGAMTINLKPGLLRTTVVFSLRGSPNNVTFAAGTGYTIDGGSFTATSGTATAPVRVTFALDPTLSTRFLRL